MSVKKDARLINSADGTKIYADSVGDSSKPALVFVHGFSASGAIFDIIFSDPKNSESFYLVRYDVRGHGRSGKPEVAEGYFSSKYAEDFAAVLQAFKVVKCIFVGWSMGGIILTDITTHLPPTTLLGAVIIAGSPCSGPMLQRASRPAVGPLMAGLLAPSDVDASQESMIAACCLLFAKNSPGTDFLENVINANKEGADLKTMAPCPGRRSAWYSGYATKLFELGKQGFPLMTIYGAQDAYMDGEMLHEELKPYFSNMETKIIDDGGSHCVFLENPKEVMAAVHTFARKLSG